MHTRTHTITATRWFQFTLREHLRIGKHLSASDANMLCIALVASALVREHDTQRAALHDS